MLLSKLLLGTDADICEALENTEVSGVTHDSRAVKHGNAFVAISGMHVDGSNYAFEAEKNGAAVYIGEKYVDGLEIPQILTASARKTFAFACANYYGNPEKRLKIIGVTGTNGKTSTAYMLKTVLAHGGYKTALIGTVKCMIGEDEYALKQCGADKDFYTMTTPDSDTLFMAMKDMVRVGVEVLVMEVSSHSLVLEKLAPIDFEIGIFTNLSAEHLDFHGSMENYFGAKAKLFEKTKLAVVNADDAYANRISEIAKCPVRFYGIKNKSGYYADKIKLNGAKGSEYILCSENSRFKIKTVIPGEFTIYNSLAAVAAARELCVNLVTVQNAIYSMNGVCGRLERVKLGFCGTEISVFIDYAHTPFALENLLKCVNGFRDAGQRIITLFGCGGDRDKEKRAVMGEIATKMSDFVIVTADNSRSEDTSKIIADILDGVKDAKNYIVIPNRKEAIEYAVETAFDRDIILLVGKGHEQYEIDKNGIHPFSEKEIVEKAISKRMI